MLRFGILFHLWLPILVTLSSFWIPSLQQQNGDVRLVKGTSHYEGLVEIYFNNEWGTICHDKWDNMDAAIVCRSLGLPFERAASIRNSFFGRGTGPIWMDDVECDMSANSLMDCAHRGMGVENCDHARDDDAGVMCAGINDVRVIGPAPHYGRVEVLYGDTWIPICRDTYGGDEWDDAAADVVCKQMGYSGGRNPEGSNFVQLTSSMPFRAYDITQCEVGATSVSGCAYNVDTIECSNNRQATVFCDGDPIHGYRLTTDDSQDSLNPNTGRLEVRHFFYDNTQNSGNQDYEWLGVCADDISSTAFFASFACIQLGYIGGHIFNHDMQIDGVSVSVTRCDTDDCTFELLDIGQCNQAVGVTCFAPDSCPEGYVHFQNSCYKVYDNPLTRCEADDACGNGGHLVDLTSMEEHQFVSRLLQTTTDQDAWIGLMLLARGSETLIWSDGSTVQYDAWTYNARRYHQECFMMRKRYGYDWEAADCNDRKIYVCEIDDNTRQTTGTVNPICIPTTTPPTNLPTRQPIIVTQPPRRPAPATQPPRNLDASAGIIIGDLNFGVTSPPPSQTTEKHIPPVLGPVSNITPKSAAQQSSLTIGPIVAGVVGLFLVIFVVSAVVWIVMRSKRNRGNKFPRKPSDERTLFDHNPTTTETPHHEEINKEHIYESKIENSRPVTPPPTEEKDDPDEPAKEKPLFHRAIFRGSKRWNNTISKARPMKSTYTYNGELENDVLSSCDDIAEVDEPRYSELPTKVASIDANDGWYKNVHAATAMDVQNYSDNEPRYVSAPGVQHVSRNNTGSEHGSRNNTGSQGGSRNNTGSQGGSRNNTGLQHAPRNHNLALSVTESDAKPFKQLDHFF